MCVLFCVHFLQSASSINPFVAQKILKDDCYKVHGSKEEIQENKKKMLIMKMGANGAEL